MENKKFAVFDFDGTLVDAMPVYFELSSNIMENEYGLDGKEFQTYSKMYTGISFEKLFTDFLNSKNKPTDKIGQHISDFFVTANEMDFPFFEGAKDTIEKIHSKGVKLFISTGSQTHKTKERLDRAGLLKYFSSVYGSSEIQKSSEHIKIFADSCDMSLEDFSRKSFFLGDGPGDMKIAKSCKMHAVGVSNTFDRDYLFSAGADFVLDKISDLVDLEFKEA